MKATNIKWDIDENDDISYLPKELEIPNHITDIDDISDYLTWLCGYCHDGFILID